MSNAKCKSGVGFDWDWCKKEKPLHRLAQGFTLIIGRRLTLPDFTPVPSARVVLTSLFGMGRGGPHRNSHLKALMFNVKCYMLSGIHSSAALRP